MNARAPRTQHPYRVHVWVTRPSGVTAVSLCGGIEADPSYLDRTEEEVDCRRCAWKLRVIAADELADDHAAALFLNRVPVTCRDEHLYRQRRPTFPDCEDPRLEGGPGVTTPDDDEDGFIHVRAD